MIVLSSGEIRQSKSTLMYEGIAAPNIKGFVLPYVRKATYALPNAVLNYLSASQWNCPHWQQANESEPLSSPKSTIQSL